MKRKASILTRQLPVKLLLLLLILGHVSTTPADTDFNGWYQVDLILLKPRSTDLEDESWPERTPEYPADILAVYPAEPFKLSQIEQALESATALPDIEETPGLSENEFVFGDLSSRNRNRRIVEAATNTGSFEPETGSEGETDATIPGNADPETEVDIGIEGDDLNAEVDNPTDSEVIRDLIANAPATSQGQLAFSDTADDSTLEAIRRSLRRSSRFDVIDHRSWIQPINSEPTPVMVQAGQRYDDRFEVEGTLSFSRSRFLHVQTDLWYTIFEPRGGSRNPYIQGFESTLTDEQLSEYGSLVEVERERGQYYPARSHVMMQSRRLRSDELHYIDHPLFGVIVRINRYTPETLPEE